MVEKDVVRLQLVGAKRAFLFKSNEAQSWYCKMQEAIAYIEELDHRREIPRLKRE